MAFEQLATCSAQMWTFNSKGQSPCVVATALERVCSPGAALRLTPLRVDLGYVYLGPSSVFETHSGCLCNSVYYSLMCACSVCQGGNYMRWLPYIENCTSVDTGGFPQPLPQGYSVPHWAYGDVVANNGWTMAEAQLDAGAEQSAVPIATKKRDTGAIIGGAVGGVVALALIGAFVFVFPQPSQETEEHHFSPVPSVRDRLHGAELEFTARLRLQPPAQWRKQQHVCTANP
ncbi:hypothetical protein DFP72DRAFT_419832 [Ephemerocybe angulata]|uniref:Uncharacterized protein n=1 Tax=Ephemerocybe angulata TaxID=980116 RepID=A0A8H6MG71_9AGAR|nr:hypothetical protein DFP72DRAFT_419832 [Tulosesus angulatus]